MKLKDELSKAAQETGGATGDLLARALEHIEELENRNESLVKINGKLAREARK